MVQQNGAFGKTRSFSSGFGKDAEQANTCRRGAGVVERRAAGTAQKEGRSGAEQAQDGGAAKTQVGSACEMRMWIALGFVCDFAFIVIFIILFFSLFLLFQFISLTARLRGRSVSGNESGHNVVAAASSTSVRTRDTRSRTISEAVSSILRPGSVDLHTPKQSTEEVPIGFGDFLEQEQGSAKKGLVRTRAPRKQVAADSSLVNNGKRVSPFRKTSGSGDATILLAENDQDDLIKRTMQYVAQVFGFQIRQSCDEIPRFAVTHPQFGAKCICSIISQSKSRFVIQQELDQIVLIVFC